MPTHSIMTVADGDLKFTFKSDNAAEVKTAMERFNDLVGRQKMWATTKAQPGKPARLLKEFDPTEDAIFMRQLQGG